jgi:hypothetical protein
MYKGTNAIHNLCNNLPELVTLEPISQVWSLLTLSCKSPVSVLKESLLALNHTADWKVIENW